MNASPPPQYSPDGRFYWDGQRWIPNPTAIVPAGPPPPMVVAPKNPAVNLIVSFFLPGVGSMMNGDVGVGLVILGLYVLGWVLTLVVVGIPLIIVAWIWGLIDAYQGARRWNARHGIIS